MSQEQINKIIKLLKDLNLHKCPIKLNCICDNDRNDGNVNEERVRKKEIKNGYDWNFVDSIFCICLKNRDDRLKHSTEQFHKYGLCTRVLYYRPEIPDEQTIIKYNLKEKGRYGCWEAHRQVTYLAQKLFGSKRNLIFEDDILFTKDFNPKILKKIKYHLDVQLQKKPWDIYYLGYMPLYCNIPLGNGLWRIHGLMSHATIQSESWINKFINMPWIDYGRIGSDKKHEIGPDSWPMRNGIQYGIVPMVAVQTDMSSDAGVNNKKIKLYEKAIKIHSQKTKLIEFLFMYLVLFVLLSIILCVLGKLIFRSNSKLHRKYYEENEIENETENEIEI